MNDIDPKALFCLSVLGPLVSRERLSRGELQQIVRQLAQQEYAIPRFTPAPHQREDPAGVVLRVAPQWAGWPVRCAPYQYGPLEAARAGAGRGARGQA